MTRLIRIQRKRTKGWRMPPNTVYVGRGSAWGNPYIVGIDGTAEECIAKYKDYLFPYKKQPPNNKKEYLFISDMHMGAIIRTLKGKNLACWCALDKPCHADLLLQIANSGMALPMRDDTKKKP